MASRVLLHDLRDYLPRRQISVDCPMRLTPAEVLVAGTLNAAWALGVQDEAGSLAPGKAADFLILDGPDYRLIPYRAGHNPVERVFLGGQGVFRK